MYSLVFDFQADVLKALAHPRRLEIVQLLRDQELDVTDIYEMLDLPQANSSQHLMILREAGVVTSRRDGKHIFYAVAHPQIITLCDAVRTVVLNHHPDPDLRKVLEMQFSELLPIVHDPVCQMRISPKTAADSMIYQGQTYYFCASGCVKKFKERPDKYV